MANLSQEMDAANRASVGDGKATVPNLCSSVVGEDGHSVPTGYIQAVSNTEWDALPPVEEDRLRL